MEFFECISPAHVFFASEGRVEDVNDAVSFLTQSATHTENDKFWLKHQIFHT